MSTATPDNKRQISNSAAVRAMKIVQRHAHNSAEGCDSIAASVQRAAAQGVKLKAPSKPRRKRP